MVKDKIRLQGVGWFQSKRAEDVKIGEKRVFNYGGTSQVVWKNPTKSGKSIEFTMLDTNKPEGSPYRKYKRTHRKDSQWAWTK